MKEEISYKGILMKGDLIEIYAKAIANLGPFNYLYVKRFDYHSSSNNSGMSGFYLSGFSDPLFAYIARRIMDANEPVGNCMMERSSIPYYWFSDEVGRRINLEDNGNYEIKAEIESSQNGIVRVKKVLDQVLNQEINPEMKLALEFILK